MRLKTPIDFSLHSGDSYESSILEVVTKKNIPVLLEGAEIYWVIKLAGKTIVKHRGEGIGVDDTKGVIVLALEPKDTIKTIGDGKHEIRIVTADEIHTVATGNITVLPTLLDAMPELEDRIIDGGSFTDTTPPTIVIDGGSN